MNDSISQALFQPVPGRWKLTPLSRFQPEPIQPISWTTVLAHGVFIGSLFGLAFTLGARVATSHWYLAPFLFAGSYSFLGGFAWAAMFRAAWNRRSRLLQHAAASGTTVPPPVPLTGLRRCLPPLYSLLFIVAMLAVFVSIENLRGSLALRAYHQDLRARQEPLDLGEILPPPLADDQNLAAIPLFRTLWNTPVGPDGVPIPDTNAQARAKSLSIDDPKSSYRAFAAEHGRKETGFMEGQRTDLLMRQAYYQSLTNWPQLPDSPPPTPGQTVLHALSRHDPQLAEIRAAASSHPTGRFPLRLDLPYYTMPLDHLSVLKGAVQVLSLRASALLAEGRPAEALADLNLAQQLANMLDGDPILISQLVRMSLETITLQPIWDGCVDHLWSPAELRSLRNLISSRQPIPSMALALRGERLYASAQFSRLARHRFSFFASPELSEVFENEINTILQFTPRGWIYFNDVAQGRYLLALCQSLTTARHHAEVPPKGTLLERYVRVKSPFHILAALVAPGFDNAPHRTFENEAWRRIALVGLALEECRLVDGQYPEKLSALVPRFLESLPSDPMDGESLRYSRDSSGDVRLYSVGPDHADNHGIRPEKRSRNASHPTQAGDLVWR